MDEDSDNKISRYKINGSNNANNVNRNSTGSRNKLQRELPCPQCAVLALVPLQESPGLCAEAWPTSYVMTALHITLQPTMCPASS